MNAQQTGYLIGRKKEEEESKSVFYSPKIVQRFIGGSEFIFTFLAVSEEMPITAHAYNVSVLTK